MSKGVIKKVAGPLVIAEGMRDANMFDVVRVSDQRLICLLYTSGKHGHGKQVNDTASHQHIPENRIVDAVCQVSAPHTGIEFDPQSCKQMDDT